jgi:hypothetical protein
MINFIKKNLGILSSLILIVLIPLFIYLNVFFVISAFQNHIDDSLHAKAILGQTIFGILASEYINDPEGIQEQIRRIREIEGGEEIIDLQIIIQDEGEFKIKAAKNQEKIGTIVPVDPTIIMPWYQDRPFAHLRMKNNERVWYVVDAFYNEKGERLGLISLTLSLAQSDALIHRTVWKVYLFLIGTVLIVLFLVAHHTKLFSYVALYNKLKEVDKMKEEFIRMATHELQAPITVIRGYLESLEEKFKDSLTDEKKEFLKELKFQPKI